MLENYIINESTVALIYLKEQVTEIIEKYTTYTVKRNILEIIDESCKFYGSSFVGRCQSAKYLLGIRYKCPIIISEVKDIIIFPTTSFRKKECMWFSYNGINNYYINQNNLLQITLINGKELTTELSENVFTNQLFKASRLMTIMKGKKH